MSKTGESLVATGDRAAIDQQLGSVGVGEFDRIGVEVLVDIITAVVPSPGGLGLDGAGLLYTSDAADE